MDKQRLAQVMRSLGKIKSAKKTAAAKENGKKGGRPRKAIDNPSR